LGILPPDQVREFEVVIMVAVRDRIDGWWNLRRATERLQNEPWSHAAKATAKGFPFE
jgi:hypothetical protein